MATNNESAKESPLRRVANILLANPIWTLIIIFVVLPHAMENGWIPPQFYILLKYLPQDMQNAVIEFLARSDSEPTP